MDIGFRDGQYIRSAIENRTRTGNWIWIGLHELEQFFSFRKPPASPLGMNIPCRIHLCHMGRGASRKAGIPIHGHMGSGIVEQISSRVVPNKIFSKHIFFGRIHQANSKYLGL